MVTLNLSERQIYRLKKLFITEGKSGFIHKNRGKENPNKISDESINELENLYLKNIMILISNIFMKTMLKVNTIFLMM